MKRLAEHWRQAFFELQTTCRIETVSLTRFSGARYATDLLPKRTANVLIYLKIVAFQTMAQLCYISIVKSIFGIFPLPKKNKLQIPNGISGCLVRDTFHARQSPGN